jgi:hypothetical protein
MGSYSLNCKKSVEKDLRKIPKDYHPDIFEHIGNLAIDPVPHESYKLASALESLSYSCRRISGNLSGVA